MVWAPSVVFSLATLVAAFVVLFLPETNNKILTQVVDDPTPLLEKVELHNQKDDPRSQLKDCVGDSLVLLHELQLRKEDVNPQASPSLCEQHIPRTTA